MIALRTARMRLIRANALLFYRGEVLADFEQQLIREAHGRVVRDGGVATPAEWAVIDAATEAMTSAGCQEPVMVGAQA